MDEDRRRNEDTRLDVITERLDNLIKTRDREDEISLDWRNKFCAKLDILLTKLNGLPCERGEAEAESMKKDIGWLQKIVYTALCIIFPALITVGIAWGALNKTVVNNTDDIKIIEQKSYGFRNIPVVLKEETK